MSNKSGFIKFDGFTETKLYVIARSRLLIILHLKRRQALHPVKATQKSRTLSPSLESYFQRTFFSLGSYFLPFLLVMFITTLNGPRFWRSQDSSFLPLPQRAFSRTLIDALFDEADVLQKFKSSKT